MREQIEITRKSVRQNLLGMTCQQVENVLTASASATGPYHFLLYEEAKRLVMERKRAEFREQGLGSWRLCQMFREAYRKSGWHIPFSKPVLLAEVEAVWLELDERTPGLGEHVSQALNRLPFEYGLSNRERDIRMTRKMVSATVAYTLGGRTAGWV